MPVVSSIEMELTTSQILTNEIVTDLRALGPLVDTALLGSETQLERPLPDQKPSQQQRPAETTMKNMPIRPKSKQQRRRDSIKKHRDFSIQQRNALSAFVRKSEQGMRRTVGK